MSGILHITYFVHGTTPDNLDKRQSGWNDTELAPIGITQSEELRVTIQERPFDVVICSDLKRAVQSAELSFRGRDILIIKDRRLRECNYGELNGHKTVVTDYLMPRFIEEQFPGGECLKDVERRMLSLLEELKTKYPGKKVALVAHQAPQLALDVILKGKTWEQAIKEDWRHQVPKAWKPGWEYVLS